MLYLPVGLVLFILRTILALSVILIGCSLSDTRIIQNVVNKVACLTLGITVTVENPEKKENVEVYVSNNLSIFDHLAVHTATGSVSVSHFSNFDTLQLTRRIAARRSNAPSLVERLRTSLLW